MVKKFIKLGELNRKHLLPLFLVIYQITYKIYTKYYPEKKQNNIINMFATSLGMMSIIFLNVYLNWSQKKKKKKKNYIKENG